MRQLTYMQIKIDGKLSTVRGYYRDHTGNWENWQKMGQASDGVVRPLAAVKLPRGVSNFAVGSTFRVSGHEYEVVQQGGAL